MNDARMNLHALLTASLTGYIPGMKGAILMNYTELISFIKDEDGRIVAATLRDRLKSQTFTVRAKYFVNATGSQSDSVRKLDNPEAQPRLVNFKAAQLMLARDDLMPLNSALVIPKTEKSGKMLFLGAYGPDGMIVGSNVSKAELAQVGPGVTDRDNEVMIQEMKSEVFEAGCFEVEKLIKAKFIKRIN